METARKDLATHAGMLSHNPYIMERNKCLLLNHSRIFGSHFTDKAGDTPFPRMLPNHGISQGIKKETIFVSFYSQEEENGEKGEKKNEIFIPLKSVTEFLLAAAGLRLHRLSLKG